MITERYDKVIEFQKLPSLSRLFRDITVTEKIDGTQSTIIFQLWDGDPDGTVPVNALLTASGDVYEVGAQSKNRLLSPGSETDNYGFAEWVLKYRYELFAMLGPGRHSGEWWGKGIQRNYGVDYRGFALFNPAKLGDHSDWIGGVFVSSVPVIYEGPFDQEEIEKAAVDLDLYGSLMVHEFKKPEGVVVFHHASRESFKFTLDNNDKHKWEALRAS